MATISTSQTLDSAARTAGETFTIDTGATFTIDTDTRYHRNAPAGGTGTLGGITVSEGTLFVDGTSVRWLAYIGGSGNVPAYNTSIVGNTSGATGALLGVYSAVNVAPTAVGSAMPATGFIKLKSASTAYNASETLTGLTATTNGTDKVGWLEVVTDGATNSVVDTNSTFKTRSKWFDLGTTLGTPGQVVQLPTCGGGANTMYAGVYIEKVAPVSATYTWSANTITVTKSAHGYYVGQEVYIDFTSGAGTPDGDYEITSVTTDTFTFTLTGSGTSGNCNVSKFEFYPAQRYYANTNSGWYTTAKGTDARSKFVEMQDGGAIRIGANVSGNYGYTPTSGLKIRIPNILLVVGNTTTRNINNTPATKPTISTSYLNSNIGGIIDIDGCLSCIGFIFNKSKYLKIKNCYVIDSGDITINSSLGETIIINSGNANYGETLNASALYMGYMESAFIKNCNFGITYYSGVPSPVWVTGNNMVFEDCHIGYRRLRQASDREAVKIYYGDNNIFRRTTIVGGRFYISQCTNTKIEDYIFADRYDTSTSTSNGLYCFYLSQTTNITINGISLFPGVSDIHPYFTFFYIEGAKNLSVYNAGTSSSPINCGSTNKTQYIFFDRVNSTHINNNFNLKRLYFSNIGTTFFYESIAGIANFITMENIGGDYSKNMVFSQPKSYLKSITTASLSLTLSNNNNTFVHYFNSATGGRVQIFFSLPTIPELINYIDTTGLGSRSGIKSNYLWLYNNGDSIIFEFPYWIKGYTSFANSAIVASHTTNLVYQYQIDTGTGWNGTWKTASAANLYAESISASGFRLKVRISATSTNLVITSLYFSMVSSASAQADNLYPLDTIDLTLTGLQTGSDVVIYQAGTTTVRQEFNEVSGTTATYTYEASESVDIGVFKAGYVPLYVRGFTLPTSDSSLPIAQVVDRAYLQ